MRAIANKPPLTPSKPLFLEFHILPTDKRYILKTLLLAHIEFYKSTEMATIYYETKASKIDLPLFEFRTALGHRKT